MPIGTYNRRPILLAPSLLAADFRRLGDQVRQAEEAGADWFQADIMDGHFVPNISFGPLVIDALRDTTRCILDVHMMISNPESYVDDFVRAGARNVTVHLEACTHLHRVIQQIKAAGITAGVALNPTTPLHALDEVLQDLDLVLIMSVNPGFGGQRYIPHTTDKIRRMRALLDERGLDNVHLQVDGGISAANVREVVEAGVTNIVAGSAIFGHRDGIAAAIEEFREGVIVTLVATIHDPADRQLEQARRVFDILQASYEGLVLLASPVTSRKSVDTLRRAGFIVEWQAEELHGMLGHIRRAALARGLATGATHLHLCDWDRVIHWAERYPDELQTVVGALQEYDCLILGRTERAFHSHPRVQRDTEALINHCFGLVWGENLDVTAASRGISRRAAERLVDGCDEPTIGNDCAWPLFLRRDGDLQIGYLATEGLEWETPDRYGEEIAAAGGIEAWRTEHDASIERWVDRVELARIEIEAIARWQDRLSN